MQRYLINKVYSFVENKSLSLSKKYGYLQIVYFKECYSIILITSRRIEIDYFHLPSYSTITYHRKNTRYTSAKYVMKGNLVTFVVLEN